MRQGVRAFACLGLLVCLASPTSARAQVEFSAVDAATVRVFAVQNVDVVQGQTPRGLRTVALPNMGHGTGFGVAGGYVLTAAHVVEGAHHLVIRLPGDGGFRPARVAYLNEERDVAVLHLEGDSIPTLTVAPAEHQLRSRQNVFAVGYPLDPSRTEAQSARGIISGRLDDGRVQLDMDLNPGNSGGPLIDDEDRVVGMVVARGDVEHGVQGIGVAVPLPHLHEALVEARQRIIEGRASRLPDDAENAARVVDTLSRLRLLRIMREASDIANGEAEPESLRQVEALAETVADPDLQVLVAGYLWDAAQVIMFRAGDHVAPGTMPEGASRELAQRLLDSATSLVRRAVERDATIADRSPFVRAATGGAAALSAGVLEPLVAALPADAPALPDRPDDAFTWQPRYRFSLFVGFGGGAGLPGLIDYGNETYTYGVGQEFEEYDSVTQIVGGFRFFGGAEFAISSLFSLVGEFSASVMYGSYRHTDFTGALLGRLWISNRFFASVGGRAGRTTVSKDATYYLYGAGRKAVVVQFVAEAGISLGRGAYSPAFSAQVGVGAPLVLFTGNFIFPLGRF